MAKESAIGDLLVRAGVIDSSGLSRALEVQKKEGISLGKALVALGLANEQGIAAAIAKSMQIEFLLLSYQKFPPRWHLFSLLIFAASEWLCH